MIYYKVKLYNIYFHLYSKFNSLLRSLVLNIDITMSTISVVVHSCFCVKIGVVA